MLNRARIRSVVTSIVVGAFSVVIPASITAQCVMCKASLTGNSAFVRNLNIGVLVLLVPPVSIFCTIFLLAIRHRKSS